MNFVERAETTTAYGIPVMPLKPKSKVAFLPDWHKKATTNPAQIAKWNDGEGSPECNCAAVALAGGFWILDVDNADAFALIEKETGHSLDAVDTLVVKSSGEKRHFYFKHDSRSEVMGNVSYEASDGTELFSARAHNQYVVSAGSIHPKTGELYEVVCEPIFGEIPTAPQWLINWILTYKTRSKSSKRSTETTANPDAKIFQGGRDNFLFGEAVKLRKEYSKTMAVELLDVINQQRCVPPMSRSVVEAKVRSAFDGDPRHTACEELVTECFADIKSEKIVWLWENRIPKGKLTIFSGNPDVGKTTVVCDIIFRYTKAHKFPDGAIVAVPGEVLYMSSEDDPNDTIKPRLEAAHVDVSRVHYVRGVKGKNGEQRQLALDTDLKKLEKCLNEHPEVGLVVIDPLTGYLGRADINKEQKLRSVLEPIKELAEKTGVAFIGLGHFNKRNDVTALHKVGGAVALTGVARAVWLFMKNPAAKDEYLMLLGKGNLTKQRGGLKYRIGGRFVQSISEERPFIEWCGPTDQDADSTVEVAADPWEKTIARAERFLKDYITEPRLSRDVFANAGAAGVKSTALKAAKKELGIEVEKRGHVWWWLPPSHAVQEANS